MLLEQKGNKKVANMKQRKDLVVGLKVSPHQVDEMKKYIKKVRRKYKFMNEISAIRGGLIEGCMKQMRLKFSGDLQTVHKEMAAMLSVAPVIYKLLCIAVVEERCYILKCFRAELKSKLYMYHSQNRSETTPALVSVKRTNSLLANYFYHRILYKCQGSGRSGGPFKKCRTKDHVLINMPKIRRHWRC